MKFLVDAQLPKKLSNWLNSQGYDSIHTLDMPLGNSTSDLLVIKKASEEKRIVISKDRDFLESSLLKKSPGKLLFISTGNISNVMLMNLLEINFTEVLKNFAIHSIIELTTESLIIYR